MSVYDEASILKTVAALNKNNFTAKYFQDRETAIREIIALIPEKSSIGVGGSWTIQQLGLLELLENQGHEILNHNKPGLTAEEILETRRRQLVCDVFLTSTNAVTMDGKLVNTDGVGNRVAAMTFGPKKVIVIAGTNKIVENVEQADHRIKSVAAPLNNKRLNKPNPCVKTNMCMDCQSPSRICNITTIISKRPVLTDFHIALIGEELGF